MKAPPVTDQETARSAGIDLFKFICAILVVAVHIPPIDAQPFQFGLRSGLGRLAVPFFFMCSGYFSAKKNDLSRFAFTAFKPRLKKIIRLYLIWSALYLPICVCDMKANGLGFLPNLTQYAKNFFITGSYTHLWYMNSLIVASTLMAALSAIRLKPKSIFLISAVLYVFGLCDDSYYALALKLPFMARVLCFYDKFFATTRNGVFFGFFFMSLGMMTALKKPRVSFGKSGVLWGLSQLFMLAEVFCLKEFHIAKEYNLTVFLAPSAFFLFSTASQLKISDSSVTRTLNALSRLIFYCHLGVYFFISRLLRHLPESLNTAPVRFFSVLLFTIAFSLCVIHLSEKEKFKWLKKIY